MRFIIHYKIGQAIREDVIEADNLDHAEARANEVRPTWLDIRFQNIDAASVAAETAPVSADNAL